ncbi:GNAT family N-acetyltransferase [Lentibacillus saliphilus]|uniref:GNAT family N-acetyltransferase n=1 Tax=Lentibacillus saliphilus TaxID=2737028 RepID=UPI001FEC4378|nr:GNAT family N-acetyltransferase [Lentibacillus saliphilus]
MGGSMTAEGQLKTTGAAFKVRQLELDDLEAILTLQDAVKQTLDNPKQLQPLTSQEAHHMLSGHGYMVGTFVDDRMIAFRAMLVPPIDDPEHLGTDAGIEKQNLSQVMYSEISVVHPDYRGNRLQTYMGKIVMAHVDRNRFRYVATTVAPFNIPSLKDKLALGMEIIALKEKYNGKLRYVLFRDFATDDIQKSVTDTKTVAMEETERQQQLLKDGYKGVSIQKVDGTFAVTYQK